MSDRTIVLTTPDQMAVFKLLQIKYAMKLQMAGLKHSSGRSVFPYAKKLYGLTGGQKAVYAEICRMVDIAMLAKGEVELADR